MDHTITRLRFRRRGSEVQVHLDGQPAFTVDTLRAARLKVGGKLTPDQCSALSRHADRNRAWRQALSYLGRRARSRREMADYLQRKGYGRSVRRHVLERLEEHEYLDDHAFARMWVDNRLRSSPRAVRALRYELKQKGVDDSLIGKVLADVDEDRAARQAAQSRLRRWKNLDTRTLRVKLGRFLAGRGFGGDTIGRTCQWAQEAVNGDDRVINSDL